MKKKFHVPALAMPAGEILTDEQCCAMLSVQPRTLRLWRRTRGLPHVKITSRIIRYRKSDVDAWLDSHSTAIIA